MWLRLARPGLGLKCMLFIDRDRAVQIAHAIWNVYCTVFVRDCLAKPNYYYVCVFPFHIHSIKLQFWIQKEDRELQNTRIQKQSSLSSLQTQTGDWLSCWFKHCYGTSFLLLLRLYVHVFWACVYVCIYVHAFCTCIYTLGYVPVCMFLWTTYICMQRESFNVAQRLE